MGKKPERCPWPRVPIRCETCINTAPNPDYDPDDPESSAEIITITGLTAEESAALLDATYAFVEDLAYHKTGQQFIGTCNKVWLRPCPPCFCLGDCRCGFYQRIAVADEVWCFPVLEVCGYRVDGVERPLHWTVSADDDGPVMAPVWRVEDCTHLVYQVPDGCSACGGLPKQDLGKPVGAAGTWEVQVRYGCAPPLTVLQAVADMVVEQVKGCVTPEECSLPDNVESVTDRGRTYKFRSPGDENSGVWSWNEMCKLFVPSEPVGVEGVFLPPGSSGVIKSEGRTFQ